VISRHWKGIAKPGQAEAYVQHLKTDTFPKLSSIPGFVRASVLRRRVEAGTEFQVITIWESLQAIQGFAGPSADIAVVPDVVRGMMASYDTHVLHYDIAHSHEPR
jgi:heme-degrading monooxygenase HmoA